MAVGPFVPGGRGPSPSFLNKVIEKIRSQGNLQLSSGAAGSLGGVCQTTPLPWMERGPTSPWTVQITGVNTVGNFTCALSGYVGTSALSCYHWTKMLHYQGGYIPDPNNITDVTLAGGMTNSNANDYQYAGLELSNNANVPIDGSAFVELFPCWDDNYFYFSYPASTNVIKSYTSNPGAELGLTIWNSTLGIFEWSDGSIWYGPNTIINQYTYNNSYATDTAYLLWFNTTDNKYVFNDGSGTSVLYGSTRTFSADSTKFTNGGTTGSYVSVVNKTLKGGTLGVNGSVLYFDLYGYTNGGTGGVQITIDGVPDVLFAASGILTGFTWRVEGRMYFIDDTHVLANFTFITGNNSSVTLNNVFAQANVPLTGGNSLANDQAIKIWLLNSAASSTIMAGYSIHIEEGTP